MARQSNSYRALVAMALANVKAELAMQKPPAAPPRRVTTAHAREYQRLLQHPRQPAFQTFSCGARTRAGTPCKIRAVWANGRCKLHGGRSTGPKTERGRRQSALNGRKGGRPRKPKPDPMTH